MRRDRCPSSSPAAPRPGPSRRSRSPGRAAPPPRPAVTRMNTSFASTGRSSRSAPGRLGEPRRRGVGGAGVAQPDVALEHRQDLGGEIAALGEQMAGRACGDSGSPRRARDRKKISASAESPPFLTKPKDSASTPARQLRSAGAQPRLRHGIGEARAVDMEAEAARPAERAERRGLRRACRRRPYSVALVIESAAGWAWWTSSRIVASSAATVSGVSLAPSPSPSSSLAPPV